MRTIIWVAHLIVSIYNRPVGCGSAGFFFRWAFITSHAGCVFLVLLVYGSLLYVCTTCRVCLFAVCWINWISNHNLLVGINTKTPSIHSRTSQQSSTIHVLTTCCVFDDL